MASAGTKAAAPEGWLVAGLTLLSILAFAAGVVLEVEDETEERVVALMAVAVMAALTLYAATADQSLLASLLRGFAVGCLAGVAVACGFAAPHVAQIGDRTTDTWTEVPWHLATAIIALYFAVIAGVAGVPLGAATYIVRRLGKPLGNVPAGVR